MSSSRASVVQIYEPFPCPECGEMEMSRVIENCRLDDGLIANKLRHFKCASCGARFFDDDAMHRIQTLRANKEIRNAIRQ